MFGDVGRHRTVAVLQGAGGPTTWFDSRAARAADRAREALGDTEFDAAYENARHLPMDDIAAFLHTELATLGI